MLTAEIFYTNPVPMWTVGDNPRRVLVIGEYMGHGRDDPPGYYWRFDDETVTHWVSATAVAHRFTKEQPMPAKPAEPCPAPDRRARTVEIALEAIRARAGELGAVSVVATEKGFCVVYANDDRLYFDTVEI